MMIAQFGDMRGSLLPFFVFPAAFVILWLLLTGGMALFVRGADGRALPFWIPALCGFGLALVATVLLYFRLMPHGSYGPGP
jgi:hypothetical protein